MNQVPYLEFCGISKEFPGVKALQNVSFSCQQGSVHALMGENGAGKSTLLKILSGFQAPTTGVVKLDGQEKVFQDTVDALESGIAIIYQELHLVPEMTIAEIKEAYRWYALTFAAGIFCCIGAWVAGGWQLGLPVIFVATFVLVWVYECTVYPRAARRVRERLA